MSPVSELEGAWLDAAVAVAEGYQFGREWPRDPGGYRLWPLAIPGVPTLGSATLMPNGEWSGTIPRYSRDWSLAGQIIERARIELQSHSCSDGWWAGISAEKHSAGGWICVGPSHLIAAMRVYVASKLGAQVELP